MLRRNCLDDLPPAKGRVKRLLLSVLSGLLILVTVFAWFHGSGADGMFSADRILATDNAMMVLSSLMIAVGVIKTVHVRIGFNWVAATPVEIALLGMAVEAMGWVVHRSYWMIWRLARDKNWWQLAETLENGDCALYVTGAGFVLILTGAIMVVNPWSRGILGKYWFLWSAGIAAALWAVVYQLMEIVPSNVP